MFKAIVFSGVVAVALAQYPQQGAAPQAPQGAPYSFSSSVNHAGAPAAGGQYGAPQQQYGVPQQQYAAPAPAPAGYAAPNFQQFGAQGAGSGGGFGNIQQIASQNPAFNIQVPTGQEQNAYGGAPQPAPGAYAPPAPQYAAPQQAYGAPQAGAGNPYGGPFQYSSSVTHSVPQAAQQAAPQAPGPHNGR